VVFRGSFPTVTGVAGFRVDDCGQDVLPRARGERRVARSQVSLGDHQVYLRGVLGFVAGVREAVRLTLISGLEALLLAGLGILDVIGTPAPAEQTEAVFHQLTHVDEPTAAGEHVVSEQWAGGGRFVTDF